MPYARELLKCNDFVNGSFNVRTRVLHGRWKFHFDFEHFAMQADDGAANHHRRSPRFQIAFWIWNPKWGLVPFPIRNTNFPRSKTMTQSEQIVLRVPSRCAYCERVAFNLSIWFPLNRSQDTFHERKKKMEFYSTMNSLFATLYCPFGMRINK